MTNTGARAMRGIALIASRNGETTASTLGARARPMPMATPTTALRARAISAAETVDHRSVQNVPFCCQARNASHTSFGLEMTSLLVLEVL